MRNKEAKMLDRTNETPVNGTENEIRRVNFLVRAGELSGKKRENIWYEREKMYLWAAKSKLYYEIRRKGIGEAVEGSQKDYKGVFYYGYCSFFLPCRTFNSVFHARPNVVSKSGKDGGMS